MTFYPSPLRDALAIVVSRVPAAADVDMCKCQSCHLHKNVTGPVRSDFKSALPKMAMFESDFWRAPVLKPELPNGPDCLRPEECCLSCQGGATPRPRCEDHVGPGLFCHWQFLCNHIPKQQLNRQFSLLPPNAEFLVLSTVCPENTPAALIK